MLWPKKNSYKEFDKEKEFLWLLKTLADYVIPRNKFALIYRAQISLSMSRNGLQQGFRISFRRV